MNRKIPTTELNLSRTIDASPAEVFDAWLDHTKPGSPWCGVAKAIVSPPQVDGLFYSMYEMQGSEIAHYGRFITLARPTTIQHTWVSEATQGLESVVTLTFRSETGKTLVHIHHANVPDDEGGHRHEQAWGYVLAKMTSRFAKAK